MKSSNFAKICKLNVRVGENHEKKQCCLGGGCKDFLSLPPNLVVNDPNLTSILVQTHGIKPTT